MFSQVTCIARNHNDDIRTGASMADKTGGRPRTKPAEERRHDLITSAEHIFLEKGVDQTTIEDITQGAKVSKGAFYLHFSSKADIINAMRERFVQALLNGVVEEVSLLDREDWSGKLQAWARACAMGYLNASRLHDLVFAAAPLPNKEGLTSNILIDDLTTLLAGGHHAKAWSVENPAFTAIFLFNALHGVVNRTGVAATEAARRQLVSDVEKHFRKLVN